MKECKIKGCNNKHCAKNYCIKHYYQIYNYGKILERTKFDKNEIIDCGDYYEICLYNYKNIEIARTKIDKDDLKKVKKYKHHLNKKRGYVYSSIMPLHHLILGKPTNGNQIDHINHNKLDNRKQNLRLVTPSQNSMNRKAKGYCWSKEYKKWRVYIGVNNKIIDLGWFVNEQDAINTRKDAEQKYFGKYAYRFKEF